MDLPDGVEVIFDAAFDSEQESAPASTESTESEVAAPRDYHQEAYPQYQPPHKRGHNSQPGDKFVNFKNRKPGAGPDPDKVEGVDNDKYQRLKLPISFALPRDKLARLKEEFPGVYFHCRDNGNHDHPYSHVVTQLGTRFLQRRCNPGSRILDVYGNPNACDRFNHSQIQAENPKFAKALCMRFGGSDFIREVNKWGPFFDEDQGERYYRNSLQSLVDSGDIRDWDVLQMIHTLYYVDMHQLCNALHAPCAPGKKRKALALVHRHDCLKGVINDGEQSYVKRNGLVKQTNIKTNSVYVHPDITPLYFSEHKQWFPEGTSLSVRSKEELPTKGLAWECHYVNDDTWIIELVPITNTEETAEIIDYAALWDVQDEMESGILTPGSSDKTHISEGSDSVIIATDDGRFVELDICSRPLFNHIRAACVGKQRDDKLIAEMVKLAQHKCSPSPLFGNKAPIKCPPDKIYDHVLAAVLVDVEKEVGKLHAASSLMPIIIKHGRSLGLGTKLSNLCMRDLVSLVRNACAVGKDVNRVARSTDYVDVTLTAIDRWAT